TIRPASGRCPFENGRTRVDIDASTSHSTHRRTMGRDRNALLPGTLDMLILNTLTRDAMHGYGIAHHIKLVSDEVLHVEEGSLYPALQRLELRGWIKSEWGHSAKNRRARYYRLTVAGRKQLVREVSAFERMLEAISRVMRPA